MSEKESAMTAPLPTPAPRPAASRITRRHLLLAAGASLAGCGGGGGAEATPAPAPTSTPAPAPGPGPAPAPATTDVSFTDVSVHDPAVLRVGSTWYVFGSHLAAAKTTDLRNWSMVGNGVNNTNPLFTNVTTALADTFAWAQVTDLWAPDVQQLPDGRFAFYYNACKGDSPRSAMGLAVSNAVEGPYQDQGIFLKSGMWGEVSEDGANVYDAKVHPNTVDPQAFADASGQWWLLYGSYSGGLFILKLDATTGKPVAGQGYGTRLIGGNHARIEGGYILRNPDTGWYYLFMSFGGLDANGAYNMRVARSRNPDGPYVDGMGRPMTDCKADASKPLFDDASIAPYGQKLVGNHQFALATGETGSAPGYVSAGHNSAYFDAASGQYLIFFHTRFPGTAELHQVRVHAFHFNADDWPVIAPLRHVPLSLSATTLSETIDASEVAGTYKMVDHGKDISATIKASSVLTLAAGGAASGGFTGTWHHDGNNLVTLTAGDGTAYAGVLSRQWNPNTKTFVVCFSAQSAAGVSLWGIRTGAAT